MDHDGYPESRELNKIRKWTYTDFAGLLEYVKERWKYSDCGYWRQVRRIYRISTGGWSGNESIVAALMANRMFWAICWVSSKRGGHYVFQLPKPKKQKQARR